MLRQAARFQAGLGLAGLTILSCFTDLQCFHYDATPLTELEADKVFTVEWTVDTGIPIQT